MYAVIATGGKQARVEEGQRLDVELLTPNEEGVVTLTPVLIVDGETTLATPDQLGEAYVEATVVGEAKGPKIKAMTYQAKARRRRRWGHRQHYTTIEITKIWTDSAVRDDLVKIARPVGGSDTDAVPADAGESSE